MLAIRHVGVYVDDIQRMEQFYTNTFGFTSVCSNERDKGELFDELYGEINAEIVTTKIITDYGKRSGQGDMIEFVKVLSPFRERISGRERYPICLKGTFHIALEVDDICIAVKAVRENGGSVETRIYERNNGNKLCFCRDPEGNWIELIWRKKRV